MATDLGEFAAVAERPGTIVKLELVQIMENAGTLTGYTESISKQDYQEPKIYKIGDLAREFDVTLRTLRFYEDRGLITPSRSGTTRLYSAEDRERLQVALFCKRIGLSLGDIRKVLDLHEIGDSQHEPLDKIREVYASQLKALERQHRETLETIADLKSKIDDMDRHR